MIGVDREGFKVAVDPARAARILRCDEATYCRELARSTALPCELDHDGDFDDMIEA